MKSHWMRVMELAFGLLNEIDLALNEVDEEPPITEDGQPNIDDDHPDAIWGFTDQDIGDVIHESTTFHIIDICIGCGEIEEACACTPYYDATTTCIGCGEIEEACGCY